MRAPYDDDETMPRILLLTLPPSQLSQPPYSRLKDPHAQGTGAARPPSLIHRDPHWLLRTLDQPEASRMAPSASRSLSNGSLCLNAPPLQNAVKKSDEESAKLKVRGCRCCVNC
eukprot:3785711-Rhodomonas_salina.2